MKRLSYVLLALFAIGIITSCGQKRAKDINVADLETACDCVDARLLIMEELMEHATEAEKLDEAGEEDDAIKEKLEMLNTKLGEVEERCEEIVEEDKDYEDCKNYKKLEDLIDEFYKKFPPVFGW